MKFKFLQLTGFWPSEFKSKPDYEAIFIRHQLHMGRMVGGSKSGYYDKHPDNVVVFNANIVTKKSGKIWYGDLDITLDFDKLKDVADETKEDLYILREYDGMFNNENAGFKYWKENAVEVIKTSK